MAILAATHIATLLLSLAVARWGIDGWMRGMQWWMCWAPAPTKR